MQSMARPSRRPCSLLNVLPSSPTSSFSGAYHARPTSCRRHRGRSSSFCCSHSRLSFLQASFDSSCPSSPCASMPAILHGRHGSQSYQPSSSTSWFPRRPTPPPAVLADPAYHPLLQQAERQHRYWRPEMVPVRFPAILLPAAAPSHSRGIILLRPVGACFLFVSTISIMSGNVRPQHGPPPSTDARQGSHVPRIKRKEYYPPIPRRISCRWNADASF